MRRKPICPICKRETYWWGNPSRPFCSERCKLIDLASWVGGEYMIPGNRLNPSTSRENEKVKMDSDPI